MFSPSVYSLSTVYTIEVIPADGEAEKSAIMQHFTLVMYCMLEQSRDENLLFCASQSANSCWRRKQSTSYNVSKKVCYLAVSLC